MFKLLITKFWPILIPVIIYLLWRFFILSRIKTKREEKKAKAFYLLVIGVVLSLIMSILVFFFTDSRQKARYYTPAKISGDKIEPAILK